MGLFKRSPTPSDSPAADDALEDDPNADTKTNADDDRQDDADGSDPDRAAEDAEEGDHEDAASAEEDDEDAPADEEEDEADDRTPRPPILPRLAATLHTVRLWRGWTPTLLVLIFAVALFLRGYFYWPEATPDYLPPGTWLLSGNDPDYHKRAVDHLALTHQWLTWDPLQNFPQGGPNPNPPGFETSALLLGYLFSPFAPDMNTAIWWGMQVAGAFWSSMLVFPTFFVAREMFGRRAGLIAAFLLAIMAGNIERNVVGFSDHDGFLMFFITCGFFFFIRAQEYTKNRTYIASYKDLDSVTSGFLHFLRDHRVAILYTLMAATMWSICALAWKGFPYIYAIIIVYYFFSIIAMRWFRHEDPFAMSMLTMIAFTFIIAVTIPYYYGMHFMHWYEIYYLLWSAAALITLFFVPTRNIPWVLILGTLAAIVATTYIVLNVFAPDIADTIFSGAGYFSRNKLYTTIAEAQPPDVSRLVASYGYATSLLALGGIGVMAFRLPRRWSNAYVLMLAWAAAAIYMALTAVRFMYNATPLFAILAGWMLWGIIDKTGFSLKTYRDRYAKYLRWRKIRTIPVTHWAVAFFLVFQVFFPNFMQGLDAGIPFETKRQWDRAIYYAMPDLTDPFSIGGWTPLNDTHIFRPGPGQFDPKGNGLWYLGAFGTSFMNDYWAVAMTWLASQDRQLPEEKRPGFISWWDYGHWAMHVGEHPTAADNFQNGFEFAGNFIGAPGEDAANSLILARYLETVRDNPKIVELAKKYLGPDGYAEFEKYAADPGSFTKQILGNPTKYMPRDPPISDRNAFYILVSALISDRVSPEDRVWWIRDVKEETGFELRYFAVDVRMMPFSASQTGIFYAPIILADYDKNDFVQILCHLSTGRTIPCDEMTAREYRTLTSTEIVYKPHFYDSMFTRAYLGYTSNDLGGGAFNGFPGIRASCKSGQQQSCLQNQAPMQGWNLSHWRMVQRTVYFNPNATDLANHSKDWRIITDQQADAYEGNTNVTVDRQFLGLGESTGTGVMYLKYYAGAWVNGTVRTADGDVVPGARVTVYDDLKLANPSWIGVPHGYTFADQNGHFSALVPFGNVTLVASTGGNPDPFQLKEQVEVGRVVVPVSDHQAMRVEEDLNGDGVPDFNLARDIVGVPGALKGRAYLDADVNGVYTATGDVALEGALIVANGSATNASYSAVGRSDGTFGMDGMAPGLYNITAAWGGHNWTSATLVRVGSNQTATSDVALKPGKVSGNATDALGVGRANVTVELEDLQTGVVGANLTDAAGAFGFNQLLPGNYTLRSALVNATPFTRDVQLTPGEQETYNFTAADTVGVHVAAYIDADASLTFTPGEGAPNATVEVEAAQGPFFNLTQLNGSGLADARFPAGGYVLRADYRDPARGTFGALLEVNATEGANWTLRLLPASHVNGTAFRDADGDGQKSDNATVEPAFPSTEILFRSEATGAVFRLITRPDGGYDAVLPWGTYAVQAVVSGSGFDRAQVAFVELSVNASTSRLDVPLVNGTRVTGTAGFDADLSGSLDSTEQIAGANLTFARGPFLVQMDATSRGDFTAWLTDGNWSLTVRAQGYATNATSKLLNASDTANNTLDAFVEALPVQVAGRVGFDANGDGVIDTTEGFAGVQLNLTAQRGTGAFFNGTNTTVTTNATGDFRAFVPVGHYAYNLTVDREAGALEHRYDAYNATTGASEFNLLIAPQADNLTLNVSMRQLSHVRGIACFDGSGDGACQVEERPTGATVTLRGAAVPAVLITGAGGAFDGYVPSRAYTLEVSWEAPGAGTVKAFEDVNLTGPQDLGIIKLKPLTPLRVHAFNDKDLNGIEDDGAESVTGPTITLTNVTTTSAAFANGNATVQLLPGRTYHFVVDQQRSENVNQSTPTVFVNVLYHAEGNLTFDAANPVFNLPLPRRIEVSGAFFFDRNGDGRYTPGLREEPVGAFIEFRDAANPSRVVLRQEVPQTGSYDAFLWLGNYTVTVDHSGFNGTNASWGVDVTETPPQGGFKLNLTLTAHDVELAGYTYLDSNRNGRLNAFEAGMAVTSLWLFNATNLSEARLLSVAPDGRFNVTLKPGIYNLYAVGEVAGTAVAGLAQVAVDPVGGLAWSNVSLRQAFYVSGFANFTNTTGSAFPTPPVPYTVTSGAVRVQLNQSAGAYNLTLPDGAFAVNATVQTTEFGRTMNYTARLSALLDLDNMTQDLNFTRERLYTVAFNYTPTASPLAQGASVNYTVNVTNTGTDNATFDLASSPGQLPGGWTYDLEKDNVTLDIGASDTFWILINTSNQTRSGNNTLQLKATPRNATGAGGTVDLQVPTRQDFGIDVRQDVDAPADTGPTTNYFVAVENKGNGIDKVRVTVDGVPQGYTATPDRGAPGTELELQPFRTERVIVALKRDATAGLPPAGAAFTVHLVSVSDPSNATAGSARVPIVYGDLRVGGPGNATRVNEPGRGSLVDSRPLTTPGFEGVAVLAAVVGLERVLRRSGGKRK